MIVNGAVARGNLKANRDAVLQAHSQEAVATSPLQAYGTSTWFAFAVVVTGYAWMPATVAKTCPPKIFASL
ncbi:hypothetical protein [Paraburkholderia sp.]|jgi:hypothetical protein|uniref:hypothetical protein n=1 Tax=Paraburkholderia sp. TaxID=1926495 RepID=UPI002F3F0A49